MSRRIVFIAGAVSFLAGCITSLYLAVMVTSARIEGIFTTIVTDSPTNRFKNLSCPLMVGKNETASVVVSILNPATESLDYSVRIAAYGFVTRSPEGELEIIVPGGQTAKVTWVVTAVERGNQAIAVEAISNRDSTLAGPFHSWPTSFREGCGVFVIDGPWTGLQVALSSLTSMIVGAIIAFWRLYAKIRARRNIAGRNIAGRPDEGAQVT